MVNIVEHDTTPSIPKHWHGEFLGSILSSADWIKVSLMEGRPDLVQTLQGAFMEVRLNFPAADVAIFHITCCWCYYPSFGEVNPGADAGQVQWEVVMEDLLGSILDCHPSTEYIPRLIAPNQKTMLHWVPIFVYLKIGQVQQMIIIVTMSIQITTLGLTLSSIFRHTERDKSNPRIDG